MDYLAAADISRAIKNKAFSCSEYMAFTLERINRINPEINAIVSLADEDSLMRQAKLADAALAKGEYWGWLHGMPHAVKDLANIEGFVTTFGSPIFESNTSLTDDTFVARLRAQGAIFIGKTNVPEFGLGSQTYNPVFGATSNAFNAGLTAGGSSGGAASALARKLLPVADGSDMMGSLRNPAAYNNVIGFRPSLGRIAKQRNDLFFEQLSTDGPMARTVEDVIQLFTIMAGEDKSSPLSGQRSLTDPANYEKRTPGDFRVAWLADYNGYLAMEPEVLALCETSLKRLADAGMKIAPTNVEFSMASLWQCWLTLRHWFVSGSRAALYQDETKRARLKPELIWEIEQGQGMIAADLYAASIVRSDWYRTINKMFESADILALPAAQVFPFAVDTPWPTHIAGQSMDTYHRWMEVVIGGTLCGCPVISLPAGFDHGRAMGIQFMAPMGEDEKLLQFARVYETINPWSQHYVAE